MRVTLSPRRIVCVCVCVCVFARVFVCVHATRQCYPTNNLALSQIDVAQSLPALRQECQWPPPTELSVVMPAYLCVVCVCVCVFGVCVCVCVRVCVFARARVCAVCIPLLVTPCRVASRFCNLDTTVAFLAATAPASSIFNPPSALVLLSCRGEAGRFPWALPSCIPPRGTRSPSALHFRRVCRRLRMPCMLSGAVGSCAAQLRCAVGDVRPPACLPQCAKGVCA